MNRLTYVLLAGSLLLAGLGVGYVIGGAVATGPGTGLGSSRPSAGTPGTSGNGPSGATPALSPGESGSPGPSLEPTPIPTPTPVPTPELVPAPLTGVLVSKTLAARHPIAVMVDDHPAARPQSGFSEASIVWQAPAEGGIPRYMLVFAEGDPRAVGPVRSARYYYIGWAAEWRAVYGHVGGSPQALAALRDKGSGQWVFNADQFRWGVGVNPPFWRITQRRAPHNVYSDGTHLRVLARRLKATAPPAGPIWRFGVDIPIARRPIGGRIDIRYPLNRVRYDYDRKTNTYLRSIGGKAQFDAVFTKTSKVRVAPKNVVVMFMRFGPLRGGNANKHRLEAQLIGKGVAYVSTNGRTIKGTWRKSSMTGPTRFYDSKGRQVTLTAGQTFVQVVPLGTSVSFTRGKSPPAPSPTPLPSPGGSPSATAPPSATTGALTRPRVLDWS